VERHFVGELGRPELLNRLGENVVVFEPITNPGLRRSILQRKIVPLHSHLQERFGVNLRLDEELEGRFVESARMDHGGRGLNNAVENLLLNPLSRFLFGRRHQLRRGRTVAVHQNGSGVEFELSE
jgi:ATP-dependent Clp protease ATP-binding subunit ClpA